MPCAFCVFDKHYKTHANEVLYGITKGRDQGGYQLSPSSVSQHTTIPKSRAVHRDVKLLLTERMTNWKDAIGILGLLSNHSALAEESVELRLSDLFRDAD